MLPSDYGEIEIEGVRFHYFSYFQESMKVTGFRWGNFAYVSDIRAYSEEVIRSLQGVDTLILSALAPQPTPMHFGIEEAIAFSRCVHAKKTYLTHLAHDLEYAATNLLLPPDVRMSYDGLEIELGFCDERR